MIFLYHKDGRVSSSENARDYAGMAVTSALLAAARENPGEILVWCEERLRQDLNHDVLESLLHHKRMLLSFNASGKNYLDPIIGYAEETSPFIPVNREVRYPTWQMSGHVGMVHAAAVNAFSGQLYPSDGFDYFLTSFAKRSMRAGLLCYSEPALIKDWIPSADWKKAGIFETFRFIRQHYKLRWTALVFADIMLFQKRLLVLPYLVSLFFRKRSIDTAALKNVELQSSRRVVEQFACDVVIPTIGRKPHLYNVLVDLSRQTVLPKTVIIVEQNADPDSVSELDYLENQDWPFGIDHIFTHRTGACNARNMGLARVKSEFLFMGDDDIRFGEDLISLASEYFMRTGNEVLQASGLQTNEEPQFHEISQHAVFGSGLAFLKRRCLDGVSFADGFEYGYGEDKDFGMQLRNKGYDILFIPFIKVVHLKAPMGGFRTKPQLQWDGDDPIPKPSPTVMLFMLKNMTQNQLMGYKLVHFFKNYGKSGKWDPVTVYRNFNRRWDKSVYWATQLAKR